MYVLLATKLHESGPSSRQSRPTRTASKRRRMMTMRTTRTTSLGLMMGMRTTTMTKTMKRRTTRQKPSPTRDAVSAHTPLLLFLVPAACRHLLARLVPLRSLGSHLYHTLTGPFTFSPFLDCPFTISHSLGPDRPSVPPRRRARKWLCKDNCRAAVGRTSSSLVLVCAGIFAWPRV